MTKMVSGKRSFQPVVLALVLAASLLFAGCSSDGYDTPNTAQNAPVAGAQTNVLIEPATLKSWMDQGLVNNDDPFNQRVVVIDYGPYDLPVSGDTTPRIKGACKVAKPALIKTRKDGLAPHTPLVATGEQMDAVIQNFGIEEDTVIVITSKTPYYATRAYFTFRYWGFPKEQIKLLNGFNGRFAQEYPDLMTLEGEEVAPSSFSVRNLGGVNSDLRASMGELLGIIKGLPTDDANVLIDARGDSYYLGNKSTPALISDGVVVVDGHPEGGQFLGWKSLFVDPDNGDYSFKDADTIRGLFEAKGWAPGKKVTVYCTSAYSATPLFVALDAILDAPVQLHDGSWSQTGLYSDFAAAGGQLPAGSPWAIDDYLDSATVTYNQGLPDPLEVGTLQVDPAEEADPPFTGDVPADDSDVNPAGNDIEVQDQTDVGSTPAIAFSGPVAGDPDSDVLIDASVLETWMNAGLLDVAPETGTQRVVLLDAGTATKTDGDGNTVPGSYAKSHIPGAQLWDISKHVMTRLEGPASISRMVVDAATMNTLIQEHGIDENTTIVLTSSLGGTHFASRAYFTFRYYGWPKDQIKVLNGYNGAWIPAQLVSGEPAAVTPSNLTVQDIGNLRDDLRASLPEMMDAIRDDRGVPVDVRGDRTAAGSTSKSVFDGRPQGGTFVSWQDFSVDYGAGDYRFKSAAAIEDVFSAAGVGASEDIISFCTSGYLASVGFFVVDGILDRNVMIYDGSWSQWGMMSDNGAKEGQLSPGSPWAVDNATYMEIINYSVDHTLKIAPLNPDESLLGTDPTDPSVNQVENEDVDYQQQAVETDGGGGAPTPVDSPAIGC